MYLREERVSVVVMFNHLADAHDAAVDLLAAVLGDAHPPPAATASPAPAWLGNYIEPETGLAVRIDAPDGNVRLRYGHFPERLDLHADGSFRSDNGGVRLRHTVDGLRMDRPHENQTSHLLAIDGTPAKDIAGRYRCAELDAELTLVDAGGVLYGSFSGFLGQGRMETLGPVAGDVWVLPCPRALDHTPPGDWTLAFRRDTSGSVSGVEVGCWLARRLVYSRVA
jgi:D-aminopeptidase